MVSLDLMRLKLRLLLLRDFLYFVSLLGLLFLPSPFGLLVGSAVILVASKRLAKPIGADTVPLEPRERRLFFALAALYFLILFAMLALWIFRHPSPPAFAMGSLGAVVLLVLFYAAYDAVYGKNPKV